MRLKLATASALAIVAAMSHQTVSAAEVSDQGAKELQGSLTKLMPPKAVEKGIIAVTPQSDKYQILYDLPKLMGLYDSADFTLKQITPMTLFAKPADGGLWQVEGNNDFAISTTGKSMDGKESNLSYSIAKIAYTGLFDPAISYFRSGDMTTGPGTLTMVEGPEQINLGFSGANYTLSSVAGAAAGTMDFRGSGSLLNFNEKIVAPEAPFVFSADRLNIDAGAAGINPKKLQALFLFVSERVGKNKLAPAEIDELKGLVRDALPFFTGFDEKIDLENANISLPQGAVTAKKMSYDMAASGPLQATEVTFGIGTQDLALAPGMVPPLYASLVPTMTDVHVAVPNLNLQAPIDVLLNADYTKEKPISEEEAAGLGMSVFQGGAYTVNIPKSTVSAPAYDLEISGKVRGTLMQPDRVAVDAVVLARDFDKTMEFVQELGKADPQVMQVFLGMTMIKGLAKTDADGRQRWEINVDQNRKVKINGNLLPF